MSLDLVILAADRSMEEAVRGILERPEAIRIRPIQCSVLRHPEKDPGCFHNPQDYLLPYARDTRHALVMFDRAWEGVPELKPDDLAGHVEKKLRPSWGARAKAVVIDPELEAWIWSDSPHVDEALGWKGHAPPLRVWLDERGYWPEGAPKPLDPKTAYLAALEKVRQPRSSATFRRLATSVGLGRCRDRSFARLVQTLREWFPKP